MNFLDLFSGIGGFALAARMANLPIERHYYSEIADYPQQIYKQHFPEAEALGDVQKIAYSKLPQSRWLITGGFPCQDISIGNTRAQGLAGSRSGLWFSMLRAVDELRPEYLIAENVPALCTRGLDRVLQSLAEVGYDAEWSCISAGCFGAPHKRERIWIVAYPSVADADLHGRNETRCPAKKASSCRDVGASRQSNCKARRHSIQFDRCRVEAERSFCGEPLVSRVDDGLPHQLDRVKALGNAIVPHVAANIMERLFYCDEFQNSCR